MVTQEEICQVSTTSLTKSINGSHKISRTVLYKFCVCLHMTVEEANEYFSLCAGVLRDDSKEYIGELIKQIDDYCHENWIDVRAEYIEG